MDYLNTGLAFKGLQILKLQLIKKQRHPTQAEIAQKDIGDCAFINTASIMPLNDTSGLWKMKLIYKTL